MKISLNTLVLISFTFIILMNNNLKGNIRENLINYKEKIIKICSNNKSKISFISGISIVFLSNLIFKPDTNSTDPLEGLGSLIKTYSFQGITLLTSFLLLEQEAERLEFYKKIFIPYLLGISVGNISNFYMEYSKLSELEKEYVNKTILLIPRVFLKLEKI